MSDGEEMAPVERGGEEAGKRNAQTQLRMQCVYLIKALKVPVVFTSRLVFKDCSAVGFVWRELHRDLPDNVCDEIARLMSQKMAGVSTALRPACSEEPFVSGTQRCHIMGVALRFVLDQTQESFAELAKCFVIHLVLLQHLHIKQRCLEVKHCSPCLSDEISEFLEKVCEAALTLVDTVLLPTDTTMADLFDSRLFLRVVQDAHEQSLHLEIDMQQAVDDMWRSLSGQSSILPIWESRKIFVEADEDGNAAYPSAALDHRTSPFQLWKSHKGECLRKIDEIYSAPDNLVSKREKFFHRVHSNAKTLFEKPYDLTWRDTDAKLTVKGSERNIMIRNTYDRVQQDIEKRKLRFSNLESEFHAKPFLQGFESLNNFIADCRTASKQYQKEIIRIPKGPDVDAIIFNSALSYYHLVMGAYNFLVPEAEKLWAAEIDQSTAEHREPNRKKATLLFSTIHKAREVIEENAHHVVTDAERKKTKSYLRDLRDRLSIMGLKDNVQAWEDSWKAKGIVLPQPSLFVPDIQTYYVGMSSVRFQMSVMGDQLQRSQSTGDRVDPPRVPFHPDSWQADLLDIVDSRESAIVCTPTSSGKTFVSFYCIKLAVAPHPSLGVVSPPGLVVYVCPTKALLRQALASIYAKYPAKKYETGWNVYGVLEDYAFMVEKCQALVTIPEAFEHLLLSPRLEDQQLIQRVQYVIFDEIHSIDDLRSGGVWERLLVLIRAPFIALSATVANPDALASWLQEVQDGAKRQYELRNKAAIPEIITMKEKSYPYARRFKVNLVPRKGEVVHRWSDLAKYVFRPTRHIQTKDGRAKAYDANGMLDEHYHHDGLMRVHPMSLLSLRKLLDDNLFPQDMPFLPQEALQLYDIMKLNCRKKTMPISYDRLQDLEPEKYFENKGPLVSQSNARDYENELTKEFMFWVENSKSEKEYRKACVAVFSDLGSGTTFVIPPTAIEVYNAMSEAQEEEDDLLDALLPSSFFSTDPEPLPQKIELYEYLLAGVLVHWERSSIHDSKRADMLKEVVEKLGVPSSRNISGNIGAFIRRIYEDNLPHSETRDSSEENAAMCPQMLATFYSAMALNDPKARSFEFLKPAKFFSHDSNETNLNQYKLLLCAHWICCKDAEKPSLPDCCVDTVAELRTDFTLPFALLGDLDVPFLLMPLRHTHTEIPETQSYVDAYLLELLVTLNTRQMLPCIVFNFDISKCEQLAFQLCEKLELSESIYRQSDEFHLMLEEIENLKKQLAIQEKTKSSRTRQSKSKEEGEEGKDKGDFRVEKDEHGEMQEMLREIPTVLPFYSFAREGTGEDSATVDSLIEDCLGRPMYWSDFEKKIVRCLRRGIGFHHEGLGSRIQGLIEHLFRTHNLGVMISTTTLALGIHSPCRSVVLAGDHIELNSVQFRQMAGRAGRRGLDLLGHVIMLGIPVKKITRVMTSKLQYLRGHHLNDPTMELQMSAVQRSILSSAKEQQLIKKRRLKTFSDEFLQEAPQLFSDDTDRVRGVSFLSKSMQYNDSELCHFWTKCTQRFLEEQALLEKPDGTVSMNSAVETNYCVVARCLHIYNSLHLNPLNFTFLALLRSGDFHDLAGTFHPVLHQEGSPVKETCVMMPLFLTAMAALLQTDDFGLPLELHRSVHSCTCKTCEAEARLRGEERNAVTLPFHKVLEHGSFHARLRNYTQSVLQHYKSMAQDLCEELPSRFQLPFTSHAYTGTHSPAFIVAHRDVKVRSPFVALSGHDDTFDSLEDFIQSMPLDLHLDPGLLPAVDFVDFDRHEGNRSILLNACASDFLYFGAQRVFGEYQRVALRDMNGLSFGASWQVLNRFRNAVYALTTVSQVLAPNSLSNGHDCKGNVLRCALHPDEPTTGVIFKCYDCAQKNRAVFMCEKCALSAEIRCPNENIEILPGEKSWQVTARGIHEFAPYTEDAFIVAMEYLSNLLEQRRSMLKIHKFDAWQIKYSKHIAAHLKDAVKGPVRCGLLSVSEKPDA